MASMYVPEHKSRKQRDTEEYLSKIKLKEVFQALLMHVITHQPDDPIGYFHQEITKIKKEMEELNVDIESTTFLTALRADSAAEFAKRKQLDRP